MTLANQITILRILLIPLFVGCLLYYDQSVQQGQPLEIWRITALGLFLFAALSDAVDGYLSRHWGQATALGALLDPIADKLMMLAALVTLSFISIDSHMPLWFPIVIIGRDALLLLGYLLLQLLQVNITLRPHLTGKVATFFTFLAIAGALLASPLTFYLCLIGGFFALIALILYLQTGICTLMKSEHTQPLPPKDQKIPPPPYPQPPTQNS